MGAAASDSLVSYLGHLLREGLTPQQRCSWCILQPPQPTVLDKIRKQVIEIFNEGGIYPSAEM